MKDLVAYLITSLVDDPAAVSIVEKQEGDLLHYSVSVSKADLGKIIGKKGRSAKSLRTFLGAMAKANNQRLYLDIVEPAEDAPKEPSAVIPANDTPSHEIQAAAI